MSSHSKSQKDLLSYYLENVQGLKIDISDNGQDEILNERALGAFKDLFQKLQLLQGEYSKLEQTKKAALPSPPSEIPGSIRKMLKLQSAVISIQSWWRKVQTLKRLQQDVRQTKAALLRKANQSPEEGAMREFTTQLKQKKLTPESFYRICDTDYKQSIPVQVFKDIIQSLNIQLSRGQLSRLIMILDEDMEGNISMEEYTNALEAYGVSGERHKPLDGSALYHPFEHRCMFKLIQELNKKNISFIEMFNACDVNDDSRVTLSEIKNFIEGLSPDFKQKEIHALMTYIDIDKNGLIDKDDFIRQLTRGESTMRQTKTLNKQIAEKRGASRAIKNNYFSPPSTIQQDDSFIRFEEESMGQGDQSFLAPDDPPINTKSINQASMGRSGGLKPNPSTASLTPDDLRRKQIVERMEKEGVTFTSFFDFLKRQTANGLIPLGTLLKAIEQQYPTISAVDRNFLVKECIKDRTKVDFVDFEGLFARFSKNLMPTSAQTFSSIVNSIVTKMGSNPRESLKQFFKAQNLDLLSDVEFSEIFVRTVPGMTSQQLTKAFSTLLLDSDGFIYVRDLIEVLLSYSSVQKPMTATTDLKKLIPNIETMSPRTRCENVIDYVRKELKNKNIKAISVYKMADSSNFGQTTPSQLQSAFQKIMPSLKLEIVQEVLYAFKQGMADTITKQDFETIFADDPQASATDFNKSLPKQQQQVVGSSKKQLDEEDAAKWIKKLDNAMLREGVSPGVAFKAADLNHNGLVTSDELRDAIKMLVPEDALSIMDLRKIMMAFDTNRNGTIDEEEFISQIEKARNTTVNIIGSPEKIQKPVNPVISNDRRAQPTKDQFGDKTQKANSGASDSGIASVLSIVDGQVSIKELFSDIPIDENGRVLIPHIAKRFKSAQSSSGGTLKPSDYMPIVKALDPKNDGFVDSKDIVTFFDKNLRANNSDCTFELKYIANFIEFKMQNTNTKAFFENNSKLKGDNQRLMEIEVMTELNKAFGVSMIIANAIYKKLVASKGNNVVSLSDLCSLIDQYRLVKIEQAAGKSQTEASKMDSASLLQQIRDRFNRLPKKIQQEISQKLFDVDKTEKQIPYKDFFVEFVEENQLITNTESKAVYQYVKQNYQNFTYQVLQQQGILLQLEQPKPVKEEVKRPPVQQPPQAPQVKVEEMDSKAVLRSVEDLIKIPLEVALQDIFIQDTIPALQFHKMIQSLSTAIDKRVLSKLVQSITKVQSVNIQIKDIISFLKGIPGKYSEEDVLHNMAGEIDDPVSRTLSDYGLLEKEAYSKSDYLDVISSVSSVSKFAAAALFYDLSEGEEEMFGKTLIQRLTEAKNKSQSNTSLKKIVHFSEPQKDDQAIQTMIKQFVASYPKISDDATIESAINKFSQALKTFKTQADAISKFDSSGKGLLYIDWFRKRLDDIKGLTDNEKQVLTFLPIEKGKQNISEINITTYFKFMRSIPSVDKPLLSQNKVKLQQVYEALKTQKVEPKSQGPNEVPKIPAAVPKKVVEEQKQAEPGLKRMSTEIEKRSDQVQTFIKFFNEKLSDQKNRDDILKLFNQNKEKDVAYFTFYDFLEVNWQTQTSEQQQLDFQEEVDIHNHGYFRLLDFIEFCDRFKIPLQGKGFQRNLSSHKVSEANKKGVKMTCEQLEYIFNAQEDQYNGISTILTSEKAALVVAQKIYDSIPIGEEYYDPDFGPKVGDKDNSRSRKAMYFTGVQPSGYPDPELIEWLRPEEFLHGEEPMFIQDGASANDVKQGRIGDCWFISALSALATRDELLRGGIGKMNVSSDFKATQQEAYDFSQGVYPPLFHMYRKKGLYVFRFFKNFRWVYVITDDRLPCQNERPVFGTCKNLNELWVPLIEKAYAKLHGCYQSLISGFIDDALTELTGLVAEKILLHDKAEIFPNKSIGDKDTFWEFLLSRVKEKCLMGCSRSNNGEKEIVINGERTGIIAGHAYSVLDAFEMPNPNKNAHRQSHRILRVRNPWGQKEWTGKWSDRSDQLDENADVIQKYIEGLAEDERFVPGDEDGTFLINYKSWRDIYNNMYICVDFPDYWSGIRFFSQWDNQTSGGIPNPMNEESRKRWAKNPQYCIRNKKGHKDLEVFISLAQIDGRGQWFNGQPTKFPFTEVINPAIFAVMQLPPGAKKLERFDENLIKGMSVLKEHKEVSLRVKLGLGDFVIIPATSKPGELGDFHLSIYFNKPMGGLLFERLDQPNNSHYEMIAEETENALEVPAWKVDLCQKRVKSMIVQEDFSLDQSSIMNGSGTLKLSQIMDKSNQKVKSPQNTQNTQEDEIY